MACASVTIRYSIGPSWPDFRAILKVPLWRCRPSAIGPGTSSTRSPIAAEAIKALPYFSQVRYGARNNRGRASLDEVLGEAIAWLRDPARLGTPLIGAVRVRVQRRLEELRDCDATLPIEQLKWRTLTQGQFQELCVEAGGVSSPAHLLDYLNNTGSFSIARVCSTI